MTMHYQNLMQDAAQSVTASRVTRDINMAPSFGIYRQGGKRILDVVLVLLSSPFIVVIVGLLAICVACQGGKPFYTQDRVGRNGRLYKIWKLRTMVADADSQLERHLNEDPAARAEWDSTQKLKKDPRITPIGQFLRKSSMDELPQLWNVLRGDMSLIGPRPMMPSQTNRYPGTAYYKMRPGISGSWQVSARNESHFAERASFDTAYHSKVTLGVDLGILAATVRVVLRATGH